MRHITLNRAMIAFVLIYFPVATLGETGSYWRALQSFGFLVAVMVIGAIEQAEVIKRKG
jgi:hypothetical protein